MTTITKFCFSESVRNGLAKPCTKEQFDRIVDSEQLRNTLTRLEALVAAGDTGGYRALKETLPIFCFHAMRFTDDRRQVKNAIRSGLYMLDVDHVDAPADLWDNFVNRGGLSHFRVALAHVTPSGHGLRIVAERTQGTAITDEQQRLADFLHTEFDSTTCDDARPSFAVSRDHILYMDDTMLWYPDDDTPEARTRREEENQRHYPSSSTTPTAQHVHKVVEGTTSSAPTDMLHHEQHDATPSFGKLPFADIVEAYFMKKLGHLPKEGERNTQLLAAARDFYTITEGSEQKLRQVLPSYGLTDSEMTAIIHHAITYRQANPVAKIPYLLWSVIKELEEKRNVSTGIGDDFDIDQTDNDDDDDEVVRAEQALPVLPPVIRELVSVAPSGFKIPTIIATLAPLGTALTRLRAPYLDGQTTFPGFHVVIEAPQASGKSFVGRVVNTLLRFVKEHDKAQMSIEREWERQQKLNKNARKQDDDPRICIQYVPATISIAKILKRFDQSQGLTLFSFCAELDTLTKSNNRGAWSQKSDLYRIAFDGEEYGQDYMSDNSYSTTVNVKYNILSTGTPNALGRFYHDPEDGLVSRCIFGALADQRYRPMPMWNRLTRKQTLAIDQKMRAAFELSYDENGNVQPEHNMKLPWLCGELNIWLERKRVEAAMAGSLAKDIFRRRSALNGFRAGMMAYWLWGESPRHRQDVIAFALFIAELTLEGQMRRFAHRIENDDASNSRSKTTNVTRSAQLFEQLPDEFSASDVDTLTKQLGIKSPTKRLVCNWKRVSLVEKIDDNRWRKCRGMNTAEGETVKE